MTEPRICGCGCGEPIPDERRPGTLYVNDTHKDRAYLRRKAADRPKRPKQPPPKSSPPKRASRGAARELEERRRCRREQLGESLRRREREIVEQFREAR